MAEVLQDLADAPSYATVRTLLGILEQKGHVSHVEDGPRYIYEPVIPRHEMAKTSLSGVLRTFFGGSLEAAVLTFLKDDESRLSDDEIESLTKSIEAARRTGR